MSLSDNILNELNQLRNVSSTAAKERILKRNIHSTVFRSIFFHAYNPYLRYHIRKIPDNLVGKGICELNHETWVLLYKLSNRKLTGIAARESLFEHIEDLTPAAATILKAVVKKDLKCGVAARTVNKICPGLIPIFECQLVDNWPDESKINWPILIGPKLDGTRGEKRGSHFYTRRGHRIIGLDHLVKYMDTVDKGLETSGELWIPGMPFRRSDGIIRSNKPEKANVHYAIFCVPSLEGYTLEERLSYLSKRFHPLETNPLPPVVYIPHVLVHSMDEVDQMYKYWVDRGYEGLVGKEPNGRVQVGKNSGWWRKVPGISDEYKVIGTYESEEMPGHIGGIIIEGNIRVGSGFSTEERRGYYQNPGMIIGKYATIEAKEKTAAGSLRQPIFKAIRWDI